MTLAAIAKRQKPLSRSSPVKPRSGVFPRRPLGPKPEGKTTEVPLFVPDEDDMIPHAIGGSEGDEWEDFDGELEEDVQMSIAIAESLESQHRPRRISDNSQTPIPETPPRRTNINDNDKAVTDDEDEFISPSRLATKLSIAGPRKPLSTRIPSDSVRRAAIFATSTSSISPKKSTQNPAANQVLDRPPASLSEGDISDKGESDEDDDMEEVTIPQATEICPRPCDTVSPINPDQPPVTDPVETPLAIGVEDVVAKRFVEFQKIFAEKRKAFRAENLPAQEETRVTRGVFRAESPGLEYADEEVEGTGAREKGKETTGVRSSPPPQSDEDEDMEEVEVITAPPSISSRVPQSSGQSGPALSSLPPPTSEPATTEAHSHERAGESADGEDEDVPISDWSRSPSPRPRPESEAGPSTSGMALDRSRGLLDPGPPGEGDQDHEAFDAAHEMDPDAEAGEFARWMSQVKGRDLNDVRKEIEQEINGLRKEQKAAMRDSEDITGQMIAQIMVSLIPSKIDLDLTLPS